MEDPGTGECGYRLLCTEQFVDRSKCQVSETTSAGGAERCEMPRVSPDALDYRAIARILATLA